MRKLAVPTSRTNETRLAALGAGLELLIGGFSGPALIVDRHLQPTAANDAAGPILVALAGDQGPNLADLLAVARETGSASSGRIEVTLDAEAHTIDVIAVPLGGGAAMVLGREATVERNFINALIASRQLFKDIVSCSADFAWETKGDGTFDFISPRGALGYSANELNGRLARDLFEDRVEVDGANPFESRTPLDDQEVWVRRANGALACLLVSSIPVHDKSGRWIATRGLCRDVSEAREREAALARARNREMLLGKIVHAIRDELDPTRILGVAADSTTMALGAPYCWILRRQGEGFEVAIANDGEAAIADVIEASLGAAATSVGPRFESAVGDFDVLMAHTRYHGAVNGAICVASDIGAGWSADQRALLGGVGNHLGIVIAQIGDHEALERLSRTDELSGLLNRRAFLEEVERRLNHLRRMGRGGALMYVDMDNFKLVNDVRGHQAGDEALKTLADILSQGSRAGDLVARLGGDEFAIWLEEADEPAARAKAGGLLSACESLKQFSGATERPLGISIGIALSAPQDDSPLAQLIGAADAAMYEAKRGGKGSYAIGGGNEPGAATARDINGRAS